MPNPTPIDVCEAILIKGKRSRIDGKIFRSDCAIVDRLLERRSEMLPVYEELYKKLDGCPRAITTFLDLVLYTAAIWNPNRLLEARGNRERLVEVNRKIACAAAELAALIDERAELHDHSGFGDETHYHVCDVLDKAAAENYLYQRYVREQFRDVREAHDLKYWPSLSDFMQELSCDAAEAKVTASDPLTKVGTEASRASDADFFKALFAAIKDSSMGLHSLLPESFALTDSSLASLANCALDRGSRHPVRQRLCEAFATASARKAPTRFGSRQTFQQTIR